MELLRSQSLTAEFLNLWGGVMDPFGNLVKATDPVPREMHRLTKFYTQLRSVHRLPEAYIETLSP